MVFLISRRKGASRKWRERWPSKIDSKWGKHCCCCWFGQKWPRIASRMIAESLNVPKTVVLRILKEDLGKRMLCARFVPHCLTPERKEDRVPSCKTLSRWPMQTKIVLTKLLREMRPGVLPVTPKQSDRVLNVLVRHPLGRRNWNSKGPASRICW